MKLFVLSLAVVSALAVPQHSGFVDVMPRVPANPEYVPKPNNGKIVGGQPIEVSETFHQFAHAAQILFPPYEQYPNLLAFCTGQVVGKRWVMTAGHCCDDPKAEYYQVTVGASYLRTTDAPEDAASRKTFDGITRVIQHEDYDRPTIRNDICLLELPEDLVWQKDLLQPVLLATDPVAVADTPGTNVTMAGWGITTDNGVQPDLMQWTTDLILEDDKCREIYNIEYAAGEICIDTSDTHQGTCSGDSGGPLMIPNPNYDDSVTDLDDPNSVRWISVGITSYGSSAGCAVGLPDAFTDVNFYNGGMSAGTRGDDWIATNSGGAIGGQP